MYKNSTLLTIGAALFFSLFCLDVGFAFQIDRNQNAGTASLSSKQVSNMPTPCGGRTEITCRTQSQPGSGALATAGSRYISHVSTTPTPCGGRTGITCRTQSLQGSGALATAGSQYISHVSTTPAPCGGRTGATCSKQSLPGSGALATDGSQYTMTMSASAAGMLFSVGLIALVVLGARRLSHPHRHHDGHHA